MIRWLIALLTFILFEIFLVFFVDRSLAETVRAYGADHPAVIDFFRSYTDFGKSKWALWPTGLAMIIMAIDLNRQNVTLDYKARFRKASESCLFVFLCVAASGLLTDAIKPFVGRARPVLLGREEIYGFDPISFQAAWNSMPSGHSTTAIALALSLSYLFPKGRIFFWFVGLALVLSRVMVSAHYPADVLAGGAVAFITFSAQKALWDQKALRRFRQRIFPIDKPSSHI